MVEATAVVIDQCEGKARRKWQILTACSLIVCINAAFPIYGASVVNTAMVAEMGLDRSLLGLFVALNMVVTGLTAPLVGALVGRVGARLVLVSGSVLMALGALTMATLVDGGVSAILTFSLLIGLGMSLGGFIANQACVAGWYREDRARPFGVLYATMGLGGFVAAPLVSEVILRSDNWRAGWLVFVVVGIIALCLAIFVVRDAPASGDVVGFTPPAEAPAAAGEGGEGDIGTRALLILILCAMSAGAGSAFYIAHGLALLRDFGHPLAAATTSMSMMAVSTVVGNLAIGAFGRRFGVRRILALGSIIFATGLLFLGNARSSTLVFVYPAFFGIGFGVVQVGVMALLSKCAKPARFAMMSGIVFALDTVASASAPLFGGVLFDNTHTYMPMILVIAGLNALAALLLSLNRGAFRAGA
ncbi:MFS transporter [Xanthobacter autotrophicus]|uniref:MFS transporter n=1 Tax=Xanthobacter autotrophicus TaxID=280 RepID=UPI0024A646A6|nr:MFS transporter [Xanthobacter autotrophicus]MDI4655314.1 MFS transporter [Xanthobacter autotrophicus]